MNSLSSPLSSAHRRLTVGALASLLAGLAPLGLHAALPTPAADAAPAPAPVTTPVTAGPTTAQPAAPQVSSSPLNSVLDRSPFSEGYTPPTPNQITTRPINTPPANVQYTGYSIEGNQIYYTFVDIRTKQSHTMTANETWNIPNGGQVSINGAGNDFKSLNVSASGRQVDVPLAPLPNTAVAVNAPGPSVYLSTGLMGGGRRGGGQGGNGGGFNGGQNGGGGQQVAAQFNPNGGQANFQNNQNAQNRGGRGQQGQQGQGQQGQFQGQGQGQGQQGRGGRQGGVQTTGNGVLTNNNGGGRNGGGFNTGTTALTTNNFGTTTNANANNGTRRSIVPPNGG